MRDFFEALVRMNMGPSQDPNDRNVAYDQSMVYTYGTLVKIAADLQKNNNTVEAKKRIAALKADVDMYEAGLGAFEEAVRQKTRASIVGAQQIAMMAKTYVQEKNKLDLKFKNVNSMAIANAQRIAADKVDPSIDKKVAALIVNNANEYSSTDPYDPTKTGFAATTAVLFDSAGFGDIDDPDAVNAFIKEATKEGYPPSSIESVVRAHQERASDLDAMRRIDKDMFALTNYPKLVANIIPGADGSQDLIDKANETLESAFANYGSAVTSLKAASTDALENTQAFYEDVLTQAAEHDKTINALAKHIQGITGGDPDRLGRIVSDEKFRIWAKANGMSNLGTMVDGVYVEGADDQTALALWRYQQMHPDRLRPGFRDNRKHNGDLVKFKKVHDDPAEMSQFAPVGDFRWEPETDADGNVTWKKVGEEMYYARQKGDDLVHMPKTDLLYTTAQEGGYVVEAKGKTYIVQIPDGPNPADLEKVDEYVERAKKAAEAGNKEAAAQFMAGAKEARKHYDDALIRKAELLGKVVNAQSSNVSATGHKMPATAFSPETAAKLEIFELDKEGRLDRISNSNDKQAIISEAISGNDKYGGLGEFRQGDDLISEAAPTIAKISDPPATYIVGRLMIPHQKDVTPDGINFKVQTAGGISTVDKDYNLVDVKDESLIRAEVAGIKPAESYALAEAEEREEKWEKPRPMWLSPSGAKEVRAQKRALEEEAKFAADVAKAEEKGAEQKDRQARRDRIDDFIPFVDAKGKLTLTDSERRQVRRSTRPDKEPIPEDAYSSADAKKGIVGYDTLGTRSYRMTKPEFDPKNPDSAVGRAEVLGYEGEEPVGNKYKPMLLPRYQRQEDFEDAADAGRVILDKLQGVSGTKLRDDFDSNIPVQQRAKMSRQLPDLTLPEDPGDAPAVRQDLRQPSVDTPGDLKRAPEIQLNVSGGSSTINTGGGSGESDMPVLEKPSVAFIKSTRKPSYEDTSLTGEFADVDRVLKEQDTYKPGKSLAFRNMLDGWKKKKFTSSMEAEKFDLDKVDGNGKN